ncbi:hypothetical protein [Rhodohalobacter halophilus]|uniref:hypothetical protein n=1 Tax=Rhodohalobacter halophilus TaxID=1812810 RepID=UPI00083FD157|nr:hypothetical protein [Rhodohalobacter halophilus]
MIQKRFIPLLTVITGVILVTCGLLLVGFYIYTAIHSIGQADSSLIFWNIPIVFLGLMLSVAGVFFIVTGYNARTKPSLYKLSKYLLIVLLIVTIFTIAYVWFGEYRAEQIRNELRVQHEILSELMEIESVEIRNLSTEAFILHTIITGEQTGEYEMTVKLFDSQDELYQTSELHNLINLENEIITELTFDDLFKICRDSGSENRSYFCVDGAGTNNTKLNIKITLKPRNLNNIELKPDDVETSWTTSLILDTITRNGLVNVESIKEG